MGKRKRHEQTNIPGTEPVEVPEVRDALHRWLDSKDEQRALSRRVKMEHDVLIASMLEHKIERQGFTDSITGKKRHVYADRTPKAKVINSPRPKGDKRDRKADRERPEIEAEIVDPNADKVESRRVSRKSVKAELGENFADPFAATRGHLDEAAKPNGKPAP